MTDSIIKFILRRPFFKGQDRIFNYLFIRGKLAKKITVVKPLEGNFKISCNPLTLIGAKIIYTGNYEPALKKIFRSTIKRGDCVLDIGANIGFHTLYFAELVGRTGKVIAVEPVLFNYKALKNNIALNEIQNVTTKSIALGNKNETVMIRADQYSSNPGAYNLFEREGDMAIECYIGDEVIHEKVDFIKIDVEGYEAFVIEGLLQTISKYRPVIIFEYDRHYHKKTNQPEDKIFFLLSRLGYSLKYISNNGLKDIHSFLEIKSANVLALPHA